MADQSVPEVTTAPLTTKLAATGGSAAESEKTTSASGPATTGRMDPTITEEELEFLAKLRKAIPEDDARHVPDLMENPSRLVKFARARNHHLEKSVTMIHKTAKFRRKRENHDILTKFKPKINDDFKTVLLFPIQYLYDSDGGLILYHRTGPFAGSYFCKYYTDEYLIDLVTYCLEVLTTDAMKHLQKTGAAPYITFVLDMQGYGSHTLGPMGITQTLINVFQNHFPETMKRAVVVNCPWLFRVVWKVVQAFLDPVVKSKISVLGHKGVVEKLHEFADDDNIPVWLGGAFSADGDPYSPSVYAQGGMPPKPDIPKGEKIE